MNSSTRSTGFGGLGGSTSARPPANTTLSSLLAQANSLNEVDYDSELPQIRFGIDDIERMSEAVAGRGKRGRNEKGEGFNLLSNLGVNTSQLTHNIAQLPNAPEPSTKPRRRRQPQQTRLEPLGDIGPSYGIGDGDIGAWGRNWHEMVILGGIEVQRQRTISSFQKQFQQRILQNWELEKARVLQDELGVTDEEIAGIVGSSNGGLAGSVLGKSALGASTRRFPMAQSQLGKSTSESREGGLVMHTKMVRYERVIGELNQRRLRKEPFELCQALEETVKGDSKHPLLPASYHILAHLTHEPSLRDSADYASSSAEPSYAPGEPVQERQYAAAYLGDQRSNHAALLRGRLVAGGRRFLERDFERHVDETIAKNPKEAALGGVPGIKNKIRAFVDVTLRSKESRDAYRPETVNGSLLWAQLYYLVRCGYIDEALTLIAENQQHISRDDWTFPGAFKTVLSSGERRLPKSQRDQLYNDFNAHIRNNPNVDQFKYALYKLIGRFELNRKSAKVASTTEDWMWLQLSLVRESQKDSDSPQEQYDLVDLGKLVLKFGHDKFDSNGTKPLSWFNLLLFTAQFEKAIAYLYSKPQLKTDAVHFAIALAYYGLLRVPSKGEEAELLITDEADVPYLNFPRLIKQYISPFFRLEPQTALQYAYLVALSSDSPNPAIGQRQKQLGLELVRDIVLSSRSWSKLLGSVRSDGTKETGIIENDLKLLKLVDEQDYLKQVVLSAAEQSSLDSSLIDSIELYHLAGSYDKVVENVNRSLGQSLGRSSSSQDINSNTENTIGLSGAFGGTNDIYTLALKVHDVYERDFAKRTKVSKLHWDTLEVLLKLKLGLRQFEENRPDLALETFKSTQLLPLDADSSSKSKYAQNFRDILDQPVISNLDEIIITTMKCLHLLSQSLKNSPYGDHSRLIQLNLLKHQSQCLIQFASTLRLRLGSDVYRQLSSMSAFF